MFRIQFSDNQQAPVWLAGERYAIGSDPHSDLVLAAAATHHAEIRQQHGFYYLHLLDGEALVNGERYPTGLQLRDGDRIEIAECELQMVDPARRQLRVAPPPPRWSLQVIRGEQEGRKFPITGSMTFGRSHKCELCFSDMELSRRHCEFFLKDDVLEIKDLASANGVFVNDAKVATAVLQSGDRIRMGSVTLMVIGPKVDAREEDQEDATRFMPVADLQAVAKRRAAGSAGRNPLHKPAVVSAPVADAQTGAAMRMPWLLGFGVLGAGALVLGLLML